MQLQNVDWLICILCLVVAMAPAVVMARRSGKSTAEFFVSGRAAPWWLIGFSMVATTFSTDTPNLVANIVRTDGVSGNWAWWAFLLTGMTTVFFYARLWRRSGVMTDLEFYEKRYSGAPAMAVRAFRGVYLGLFFNCFIMGTVTLAAVKIANVLLGWPRDQTLFWCLIIAIPFAATSGLWGVMWSDMIQFVIAMIGSFAVMFVALNHEKVGGISGLLAHIDSSKLTLFPNPNNGQAFLTILLIPLLVQWWSVWYPGAEPGGGSYIAQRMLAAREEKDAIGGTLLFNFAHYALRPWPWILTGLASMLVFPQVADIKSAFPNIDERLLGHDMAYPAMISFLPTGILGLALAGLISAYVSTISTHLNWGSSYLVHDIYRRFIAPKASEVQLVLLARVSTAVLMILAILVTTQLETAKQAFDLILAVGAGTGLIYLMRWFWWRINAWSEISAMIASFVISVFFILTKKPGTDVPTYVPLISTIVGSAIVWITVTLLTKPADEKTLIEFYRLVHPGGPGWGPIRAKAGVVARNDRFGAELIGAISGAMAVYGALLGTGSLIFRRPSESATWIVISLVGLVGLFWSLRVLFRPEAGEAPA